MPSFPYVIVNAFTRFPFGGNPAAIVLLPPGTLAPGPTPKPGASAPPIVDAPTMSAISTSLSQPMTVFVAPPLPDTDDDTLDVRFFATDRAVSLCGHGTLAATKAIYSGLLPGLSPKRVSGSDEAVLRFRTATGLTVRGSVVPTPQSRPNSDDELYEIELPATPVVPLHKGDSERVHKVVARALGKDSAAGVDIHFVARGTGQLKNYLMVVLGADEGLDGRDVNPDALLDADPFAVIILSHLSPGKTHAFESRMFAPAFGVPEDHVCGTAHTLMTPYYASLPGSRVEPGQEAYARQVSARGGDLWVTFDDKREVVVLKGHGKQFATGELTL